MKNTDKTQFLYKSDENLIYLQNIKDFIYKKEEQKKIDFLQYLINLSMPITKKIIKEISLQNLQKGISFKNIEINIIFDCARIINIYQKYLFFILIIALTNAFSYLELDYLFAIVGDWEFKAVIKDLNESHSNEIIQRIFECITIQVIERILLLQ